MEIEKVTEDLIEITEYNVYGKLPDPFLMEDGTRVKTKDDWQKRRKEMYKSAIELQYGTQPPKPEVLEVEALYLGGWGKKNTYRITAGRLNKTVSFEMQLYLPNCKGPHPIVINGDMCFEYSSQQGYIESFREANIAYALFSRVQLANDIMREGKRHGPLYEVYPEYNFGAIGAWAWGYSRCVDALIKLGVADESCIAFTGHSRGGKTAILAGALDERATIVNPNSTCAGGCSCYRMDITAIAEDGKEYRSETMKDLITTFDYWMGEGLNDYIGRETELPFDSHYLKAMIAPRILFVSEAGSDIWANPVGSYLTTKGAEEVYKFLGCEKNLFWYFRTGFHFHKIDDIIQLVNIIKHYKWGEPLNDNFYKLPFKKPELIFDWRCPDK